MSFWFAVQLLTRLPTPSTARLDAEAARAELARSRVWFPLVGGLVGAITALAVLGLARVWPLPVAVLLALVIEALVTGAFHEDAVADFCDAMGGGRTREQKLYIMRDSRVGSYGALGLLLAVLLRAALIGSVPMPLFAPALVASGAIGRWTILLVMVSVAPVPGRDGLATHANGRASFVLAPLGLALAVPMLVWAGVIVPIRLVLALLACCAFAWAYARWLRAKLGGSTGDCLGFAAYAGQLIAIGVFAAR